MFSKTRKRLAIYFTLLMMLFLITFNGIGYLLLSSYVYKNQEKEIQALADEYLRLQNSAEESPKLKKKTFGLSARTLKSKESHDDDDKHDDDDERKIRAVQGTLRPFYVVLDPEGRLVSGAIPILKHPETLLQALSGWKPQQGDVRYFTVNNDGETAVDLIFAGRPIVKDGQELGTLYVGADVSQQKEVLRNLMSILLGLSALFVVVSSLLGYLMSGRAMRPIILAFERQRRFVSDASHELRTPLTVMHASLEVLESEEGERMQPFSRQVLDDLKDETKRMSSLVSFLLTLAQGDAAANPLALENFLLRDELLKLLRKIKPLAEEKGLALRSEITSALPVYADKERVLQLVLILLDNALQYTPEQGEITLFASADERVLTLAVTDTGIGIPPELHAEIFERFYRGDSARGRGKGQLGLGLSIAQWIVKAHGGSIHVKSAPGEGSTFTVKLPVARPGSSLPSDFPE